MAAAVLTAAGAWASEADVDAPATAEPLRRVVVLDLTANGVDPALGRNLTQLLVVQVRETLPGATVSAQGDVAALLALEAQRQLVGCDADVGCLSDIAGALGADHVVVGSVGLLGSRYLVEVRLIRADEARTVRHLSAQISGSEERLADVIAQLGPGIVDPSRQANQGWIDIAGEGEVRIDGRRSGVAPLRRLVPAGDHEVTWLTGSGLVGAADRVTVAPYDAARAIPGRTETWDLRGLFATVGLGNVPTFTAAGRDGRAGGARGRLGWRFDSGVTLQAGRTLQSGVFASTTPGGAAAEHRVALQGATAGFGWSDMGRYRLHLSLDLGAGVVYDRLYTRTGESDTWVAAGDERSGALFAQPGLEVAWVPTRYLQLGLGLFWTQAWAGRDQLASFSTLITLGLPAGGAPHYPVDFFESGWFWASALVVLVGTSAMSDQIEALAFR